MLLLYLGCFVLGGILVGASALAGGHDHDVDHDLDHDFDHDLDHDFDHDFDHDLDHDFDHDVGHGGLEHGLQEDLSEAAVAVHGPGPKLRRKARWVPFASLRFWTFFLAFFGLTGLVLDGLDLMSAMPAFVVALALGASSGSGISYAVYRLKTQQVGQAAGAQDFIGREAEVLLRVGPGKEGKVRLDVMGQLVELLATADEDIGPGEKVLVYEMEGYTVKVARGLPRDEQFEVAALSTETMTVPNGDSTSGRG